uniref:Uncharacterized protein n=1 Tax=Bactrocera latifrons TaxID=174628 RepID=A0A0K8VXA5_BACLA
MLKVTLKMMREIVVLAILMVECNILYLDTKNELLRKLTTGQSTNNALINPMSSKRETTNKFLLKIDDTLKVLDTTLKSNKEKCMSIIQDLLGHNGKITP